ncbi:MAG: OFA family MFS transporter [Candidatus Thermoplasmatota archaeon]|nr:OFA family MFS transporter [Candidatus Thermoplasmatota archaeon]MBS3801696.1 OFA family MFS transporter [Candidatus Thermoplasmatota archaeon]
MTSKKNATDIKVMNRWMVVIGAIAIQIALGAIYAWSAFTTPLQSSAFGFSKTMTQAIFSTGLATFGIFTIIGGRMQKRFGPMKIALLGGLLLGIGYLIGGFAGANFPLKLIGIGLIGGAGIGLAYVVPIGVGIKWFPDKKGLVSGLAVAGFGFGAFLWILMANPPSILGVSGLINTANYTIANIDMAFKIYGIIFLTLVVLGSLVMRNPPEGWKPKGWNPPVERDASGKEKKEIALLPKQMLKQKQFYMLWAMFLIGALAGLMVIGNVQNFAKNPAEGFQAFGFSMAEAVDFAVIGAAVSLPIFNGAGRIAWGKISDSIGRKKALISMFIFQGIMMGVFFYTTSNPIFFYIAAALIGFNFGGNFALFPAATADTFGSETVGLNYGYVFTSYGLGGIVGPILAGAVQDAGFSFTYAFYPAAVLCFVAAAIAFVYTAKIKE